MIARPGSQLSCKRLKVFCLLTSKTISLTKASIKAFHVCCSPLPWGNYQDGEDCRLSYYWLFDGSILLFSLLYYSGRDLFPDLGRPRDAFRLEEEQKWGRGSTRGENRFRNLPKTNWPFTLSGTAKALPGTGWAFPEYDRTASSIFEERAWFGNGGLAGS